MKTLPFCRSCERNTGAVGVVDLDEPSLCAVCGFPAHKAVQVGPTAPDRDVIPRAFNVYVERLQTAHDTAVRGLKAQAGAPRSEGI